MKRKERFIRAQYPLANIVAFKSWKVVVLVLDFLITYNKQPQGLKHALTVSPPTLTATGFGRWASLLDQVVVEQPMEPEQKISQYTEIANLW